MKIVGIIQVRYGSHRLPGKALLKLGGKTVLQHVCERATKINGLSHIVVATGDYSRNYFIVEECNRITVPIYRYDDEANVLLRFLFCALEKKADYVLRITGDSPFLDVKLAEEIIENHNNCDYIAHYKPKDAFPTVHKYAWGCMCELVKTDALYDSYKHADEYDREHVTSYIYNHPEKYKIKRIELQPPYPLTVSIDDEKTYQQAKKLYNYSQHAHIHGSSLIEK